MIEIPEAQTLARQLTAAYAGRTIRSAEAGRSPHRFAWYTGEPAAYGAWLSDRVVTGATPRGGMVELVAEDWRVCFSDGVNLRHLAPGEPRPAKHQLLLEFDDGSGLVATVAMYGGLTAFEEGTEDNPYYLVAGAKPSPLEDGFDRAYVTAMAAGVPPTMSAKAFLATEQRVPGLGNGVLQDILWRAGVHPKARLATVDLGALTATVRTTLAEMTAAGGRSTEKDLYGRPGGYAVVMSAARLGEPCPRCGTPVERMSYLGGNVYVCPDCQPFGIAR